MKNLIIIGARGWGREVYATVLDTNDYKEGKITIKGFLDSKSDAFEGLRGTYPPILGSVEDYEIQENDIFFVALGDSKWRKYYAEIIENKGGVFHTIISPDCTINETALIGEGSIISRWSSISDNVSIGKHVVTHNFCVIGHDAIVEDYGTLLNAAFMGGYAELGECSQMSPKSMIVPHKKVGKNVMVGAASVVINNVKDDLTVLGNPAKKLKF